MAIIEYTHTHTHTHTCEVANSVSILRELSWLIGGIAKAELDRKAVGPRSARLPDDLTQSNYLRRAKAVPFDHEVKRDGAAKGKNCKDHGLRPLARRDIYCSSPPFFIQSPSYTSM